MQIYKDFNVNFENISNNFERFWFLYWKYISRVAPPVHFIKSKSANKPNKNITPFKPFKPFKPKIPQI